MIIALSAGRDAPPELRARLALDERAQTQLLTKPRPGVAELVVLCTCHRTELYAVAQGQVSDALHTVAALLPGLRPTDQQDLRFMEGLEAVEHLFRVACGLDSLVVGEPQVLGQVRRAYVLAKEANAAGPMLSSVFDRAIRLGRRVRASTALGTLGQSIGTIAADYLSLRLDGLQGRAGAVVGAGEAAEDVAVPLVRSGARLSVLSRTATSAEKLAAKVGGSFHLLDELPDIFARSDFAVVAATGGLLVKPAQMPRRHDGANLIVLDLSVPPAVDPSAADQVDLLTLEELPGPRGPAVGLAMQEAEALLREELESLSRWVESRASGPAILELRNRAEEIVRDEIARGGAGLSTDEIERIELIAMRVVNKLLHSPVTALRDADEETRALVRRLFGLGT